MSSAPFPFPTPNHSLGALLRRYREAAGLSQEALAERAGMSARAIRYLERGSSRPYPDTLRRLATALALTPAQHEALVAAAQAPEGSAPAPTSATAVVPPRPAPPPASATLVGRERELAVLRGCLAASLGGQGGLVLLSGKAGIGKTALAEVLLAEAVDQGALALVGRCYDLAETPPYGPWTEVRSQFPAAPDLPPLPSALETTAQSLGQFFAEVRAFFAATAARQPLAVLLDDLQWADPASLDLLRYLARALATLPILIVATYRPDDLDHRHPLAQLIPLLVRESRAERIELAPLSAAALQALVRQRYRLGSADEDRLVTYLMRRTEGNALFATEMLRTLQEQGTVALAGDALGDLDELAVPWMLRQLVMGRVARLGAEAERLLGVAAVIGQEVPLELWARVGAVDDRAIEALAERGITARLLVETRETVGFAHALFREALYEEVPALRRRRLHRAVGEGLAAGGDPAPDAVAYHFRAAGDGRAAVWLALAGWQAHRAFAYETAQARFEEALPQLAEGERARVLFALAALNRLQARGIRYAEEALTAARVAGDEVLAALAQFRLGLVCCYQGRIGDGLTATEAARRILDAVPDDALPDFHGLLGLTYARAQRRENLASAFAYSGRWRGVFDLLGGTPETQQANGAAAFWHVNVLLGRVGAAQRAAAALFALLAVRGDDLGMLSNLTAEGCTILQPFLLDDSEARRRYDAELARVTRQVEERPGGVPPFLNRCSLLIAAGRWAEARELWSQRDEGGLSGDLGWNFPHLGALARAQGEPDAAWAMVREGLPDGPQTVPGTTHFTAVDLYCLATRLHLDAGEHERAREWLEAFDRWFAWAEPEVRWGRANGHLAWAEYHRATGAPALALRHAEQALAAASDPRQPLLLLAAQRLLGTLALAAGRFAAAADFLHAALLLADACAAPYERALTLLAQAELSAATGDSATAQHLLRAVRALCTPLGAGPALARAAALAATLHRTQWRA